MRYLAIIGLLLASPAFADNFTCGSGTCNGTDGDDYFDVCGSGTVTVNTGDGNDTIELCGTVNATVNFGAGTKIFNQYEQAQVVYNCGTGPTTGIIFGYGTATVNCQNSTQSEIGLNSGFSGDADGPATIYFGNGDDHFSGNKDSDVEVYMGSGNDTGTAGPVIGVPGTGIAEIDLGSGSNNFWNSNKADVITAGDDNDAITTVYGDHINDLGNGDNLYVMIGNGKVVSPGGTGVDRYKVTTAAINGGSSLLGFGQNDLLDFTPIKGANAEMVGAATTFINGLLANQVPVARNETEFMSKVKFVEATPGPRSNSKRDLKAYRDRARPSPRVVLQGQRTLTEAKENLKARQQTGVMGLISNAFAGEGCDTDMLIGNLLIKDGGCKVANGEFTVNNLVFPQ